MDQTGGEMGNSASAGVSLVETDLPCGSCGYNLRSLLIDSVCPECGGSIASSILAAEANRLSLRSLHSASQALGWVFIATLVQIAGGTIAIIVSAKTPSAFAVGVPFTLTSWLLLVRATYKLHHVLCEERELVGRRLCWFVGGSIVFAWIAHLFVVPAAKWMESSVTPSSAFLNLKEFYFLPILASMIASPGFLYAYSRIFKRIGGVALSRLFLSMAILTPLAIYCIVRFIASEVVRLPLSGLIVFSPMPLLGWASVVWPLIRNLIFFGGVYYPPGGMRAIFDLVVLFYYLFLLMAGWWKLRRRAISTADAISKAAGST